MKTLRIVSLGEVLWDLFPTGARFWGAPANFACHAASLGATVSIVSAVGDDARGHEAIDILNRYDIDISLIQIVSEASTGSVGISLDSAGKPTFTIHEDSAWDRLTWNEALHSRINEADAIYFGTLGQRSDSSRHTIRRSVETARDAGLPRIIDINLRSPFFDSAMIRDSIALASILKLSDDELSEVCTAFCMNSTGDVEAMLRGVLEAGCLDMVVMTRGAEGALLVTPDDTIQQGGIPTTVIDTVGAGDSFSAAFLIGELCGEPHEQILHRACEVAAATCAHSGAVPSLGH